MSAIQRMIGELSKQSMLAHDAQIEFDMMRRRIQELEHSRDNLERMFSNGFHQYISVGTEDGLRFTSVFDEDDQDNLLSEECDELRWHIDDTFQRGVVITIGFADRLLGLHPSKECMEGIRKVSDGNDYAGDMFRRLHPEVASDR